MQLDNPSIHVAVGVIFNANGQVLIARRAEHLHQGGLWEFPGGKVEAGESVEQALIRELKEELDIIINIGQVTPLLKIEHGYNDKNVLLDVWRVDEFAGEPKGVEGQPLEWVSINRLSEYDFPVANLPIIQKIKSLV